ncbi:MAG: BON domain-containing protein [Pirellulales bacterium]|nr:BON domain-containing protein [Pirellulales bacterium]
MRSFIFGLALVVALAPTTQVQAASPDSATMAQEIADVLKQSGKLKNYHIGVKYEDGVVWLMGNVTKAQDKQIAEQLAYDSADISHVVNRLVVKEGSQHSPAKRDIKIQVASNPAEAARQAQQLQRRKGIFQRAPQNNMPVPYARTAMPGGGRGIQTAAYNRQVQGCTDGSYMGMGPAPRGLQGPAAVGQAVNYDNPQLPGYAWPSYAASPNYAALTYPRQYSASAWPYIGPFYPYPQVPLGWRKVSLEWDDGWWFLDFKDCKHCK